MTNLCLVCERPVMEHTAIKNVHYCNNSRCTRLGVLSVFVLIPQPKGNEKPKEPVVPPMKAEEVKKDDKDIPKS